MVDSGGPLSRWTGGRNGLLVNSTYATLQGHQAHKNRPSPQDTPLAQCLGTYGGPRGVGVSYERGTSVSAGPEHGRRGARRS